MNDTVVAEYVELCERIAAQTLFSEGDELKLYDRLDRIWYAEMGEEDRSEAQRRLVVNAQAWARVRRSEADS